MPRKTKVGETTINVSFVPFLLLLKHLTLSHSSPETCRQQHTCRALGQIAYVYNTQNVPAPAILRICVDPFADDEVLFGVRCKSGGVAETAKKNTMSVWSGRSGNGILGSISRVWLGDNALVFCCQGGPSEARIRVTAAIFQRP